MELNRQALNDKQRVAPLARLVFQMRGRQQARSVWRALRKERPAEVGGSGRSVARAKEEASSLMSEWQDKVGKEEGTS